MRPNRRGDMNKFDDGGAAYPVAGDVTFNEGMTLWDYFAAHALMGYCADYPECAKFAANAADAMIAERKKRMRD